MTVDDIYERTIKPLTTAERLRLAAIILNGIPSRSVVDYSEEWSQEDLEDINRATWHHIDAAAGEQGHD